MRFDTAFITTAFLLLLTALVRLGLQEAAARVGVVSGRGLAHAAASSLGYPRWVRGVLFSGLTLAVVGASVRSLIAGSTALHTLSAGQLPPMAGSAIVAADALVLLGLHDLGVRGFEAADEAHPPRIASDRRSGDLRA